MRWIPRPVRRWAVGLVVTAGAGGAATAWIACGAAIDLGGSDDGSASALDASTSDDGAAPQGVACDPCLSVDDCGNGTVCARFASGADSYCGTLCPAGSGCDAGTEVCRSVALVSGQSTMICAPNSGACPTAVSPQSDGSVLEHCGVLSGPTVDAECRACEFSCQKNGCYSGWWCNTTTKRCVRPPTSCP